MRALVALVPVVLFASASCGLRSPVRSDGVLAARGGFDEPLAASTDALLKTCQATCTTSTDCATPGEPFLDAAHFACEAGRCAWLGCSSPSDCTSAFHSSDVTCATPRGATVPSCVRTCRSAADCAIPGNELGNAAHFACQAGVCEWQGCKSTADCTSTLRTSKVVCEKPQGAPFSTCVPTCNTSSDCAVPGMPMSDASHFACKANRCVWQGCKSTAECKTATHKNTVVCE